MPHKVCTACQKKNAVRTFICQCGHEFEKKTKKVQAPVQKVLPENLIQEDADKEKQERPEVSIFGFIYAPAGDCPVKPQKYDGVYTDDSIREWALKVKNHGEARYAPEAVVYFARYFWDIHSPEFKRVISIIYSTLLTKKQTQDFAEI
jgi:hypothetical protein